MTKRLRPGQPGRRRFHWRLKNGEDAMGKKRRKIKTASGRAGRRGTYILLGVVAAAVLLSAGAALYFMGRAASNVTVYHGKLDLLAAQALTEETRAAVGKSPAGGQAGHAVLLSVCNTAERARVFCGTGADLDAAWKNADAQATQFLSNSNYDPVWVKADIVCESKVLGGEELAAAVKKSRNGFYRQGIAFDPMFGTALLEAELNGAKIYDYDNGGLDFEYLNSYLKKSGRSGMEALPDTYLTFQCLGWFCDETDAVYELVHDGLSYGRRQVQHIDADYAQELILNASSFLTEQINEDGSFIYGIYPRFDNEIENYNILRHASTLWSLICRYRLVPDDTLAEKIQRTTEFMLNYVVYDSEGRAYLYEETADEIKLGGCGIAIVALTEYMDVFQNDKYTDVCRALGSGILSLMDQSAGTYYHVLNGDFTRKEELRTVYYDGEATFALCRLYAITGEQIWLDAAQSAVGHFIEADYTQYKDHWVAYSMNEITKHVPDNPEYYAFALANAQKNLDAIRDRDTTYYTYLELLMATFELYMRVQERGIHVDYLEDGFHLDEFLKTIDVRTDRMLNGYFYPEYAMYMANPQRILDTFMDRADGYRVRIDDVQHAIGGFYLYYKNYDKLVDCGLLEQGSRSAG